MLIFEVMIPLEEDNKELNGFLKIEFFVFVEFEHFLWYLDKDCILGACGSKDDFSIFVDHSCFAYFVIVVQHVGSLYFEFIKKEYFSAVDMHVSFLNAFTDFELISPWEEAVLRYWIGVTLMTISTY